MTYNELMSELKKSKINRVDQLISIAKTKLKESPIDTAHGVDHHQSVFINCLEIIADHNLEINLDLITISAWWHDLESQIGDINVLNKEMIELKFSNNQIENIIKIIKEHTFGKKQTSLEAKILYDADKIEYFNVKRIEQAIEDTENGLMELATLQRLSKSWLKRYKNVLENFHFEFSKKTALNNLPATKQAVAIISNF